MTDTTLPIIQIEPTGFDWHKFWRKAAIRLAYRAIEIVLLLAIGFALGLHLVRY